MLHFQRWKIILIVMTCLAGVAFTLPNFFAKETVEQWPWWIPHRQLPLGLDLRGGAHLLLAMDTNELEKDWLSTLRDDARKQLREAKIGFNVGQGTQDLGFRNTVPILFHCVPSVEVVLGVKDFDGQPSDPPFATSPRAFESLRSRCRADV